MRVIYISGAFRAPSAWAIEQNIRAAETLALAVWRAGGVALCPHTNTRFFQGAADDSVWLQGDLELLARCDDILMAPGWPKSEGARVELEFADKRGIRPWYATVVSDDPEQLPDGLVELIRSHSGEPVGIATVMHAVAGGA